MSSKTNNYKRKRSSHMKNIISQITMKELEQITYRALQESFSEVMAHMLLEMDQAIAEGRDKKRFELKDKRKLNLDSLFGRVSLRRNYYLDRVTGDYVYLLDQYLKFDGGKGTSPVVQELGIELAVTGPSYRHAEDALEKLLGYPVISHEGIRQQLINTEVLPREKETIKQDVLFVEVDGLYTKSQEKGKKSKELKIASTHQGWEMNGKRASLIDKRHFIHQGELPFWEEFEQFLMNTYDYDPTKHQLVINGDGAKWITSCREYFRNSTFVIDRFHVARDIQSIFREHPRRRSIRKKFENYDAEGFMIELNTAVGTIDHERKEQRLEELISQLSQYPEALRDYRERGEEKGIDTEGFRPMRSAEGTVSGVEKRLKQVRRWSDVGLKKMRDIRVAFKDKLAVQMIQGEVQSEMDAQGNDTQEQPPKHFVEKLTKQVGEATRNNVAYLFQSVHKPVVGALKGLRGF